MWRPAGQVDGCNKSHNQAQEVAVLQQRLSLRGRPHPEGPSEEAQPTTSGRRSGASGLPLPHSWRRSHIRPMDPSPANTLLSHSPQGSACGALLGNRAETGLLRWIQTATGSDVPSRTPAQILFLNIRVSHAWNLLLGQLWQGSHQARG